MVETKKIDTKSVIKFEACPTTKQADVLMREIEDTEGMTYLDWKTAPHMDGFVIIIMYRKEVKIA